MSWAALLGVLAGAGLGYGIQASRPAEPLPPLFGEAPEIRYAAADVKPFVLPAEQDGKVHRDGDLRELLLPTPAGSRENFAEHGEDNWLSLTEYAAISREPGAMVSRLLGAEWRRTAARAWVQPELLRVNITLHQFTRGAKSAVEWVGQDLQDDLDAGRITGADPTIPGTGSGRLSVWPRSDSAGQLPYVAWASASRGDIYMSIWFQSVHPIDTEVALGIAGQQAARL